MQASIAARDALQDNARAAISTALDAQAAALIAGDKGGFTRYADPGAERVQSWLADRFTSLHAMGIAQWKVTADRVTADGGTGWRANFQVDYCFVAGCARTLTANLHMGWSLADPAGPRITEVWEYTSGRASPPWAQDRLTAAIGTRVVVAATSATRAG